MDLLKIRDVKDATRGTPGSAGIDFFMPKLTDDFLVDLFKKNKKFFYELALDELEIDEFEKFVGFTGADLDIAALVYVKKLVEEDRDGNKFVLVPAGMDICIPTGYKTNFDAGAFIAFNKSGVSTKLKFVMGACVDDFDYRGELHMHVMNVSRKASRVTFGAKLAQFIHVPVDVSIPVIKEGIPDEEFFQGKDSERKGGFGSTGA